MVNELSEQQQEEKTQSNQKTPKEIWVMWVGKNNMNIHNARSEFARKNPYHFVKGSWMKITEPLDVKFFMRYYKQKNASFKVRLTEPKE